MTRQALIVFVDDESSVRWRRPDLDELRATGISNIAELFRRLTRAIDGAGAGTLHRAGGTP